MAKAGAKNTAQEKGEKKGLSWGRELWEWGKGKNKTKKPTTTTTSR